MAANKRILISYYSLTGNTARVAFDLAKRLDADVESIVDAGHGGGAFGKLAAGFDAWRERPAQIGSLKHDPADYAMVIVGTPVWTWKMSPAVRGYLLRTASKVRSAALFVTSGDTDVGKIVPSINALLQRPLIAACGFSERELRDLPTYERKLTSLVESIERGGSPATTDSPRGSHHPTFAGT